MTNMIDCRFEEKRNAERTVLDAGTVIAAAFRHPRVFLLIKTPWEVELWVGNRVG